MKYRMCENSVDNFKLNIMLSKALKMINKDIYCSVVVTIGYEENIDKELNLIFSLGKGPITDADQIIRFSFREDIIEKNKDWVDKRINDFQSEIIYFLLTNKEVKALIYG